ncbi:hypothetical protein X777_08077 [Ooceraea biroi]|uniref:Uncharacterized protein n=1 Tax=Ooceraea biroi TaxID=2015173 RepID=A0A026WC23_OOCBI|nr:hypothetical protein X777_08077 [Ooceraea biroi]
MRKLSKRKSQTKTTRFFAPGTVLFYKPDTGYFRPFNLARRKTIRKRSHRQLSQRMQTVQLITGITGSLTSICKK